MTILLRTAKILAFTHPRVHKSYGLLGVSIGFDIYCCLVACLKPIMVAHLKEVLTQGQRVLSEAL